MTEEINKENNRVKAKKKKVGGSSRSKTPSLPKALSWVGKFILYANALLITFGQIRSFIQFADKSFGFVALLFITGIGIIVFAAPSFIAWAGPSTIKDWTKDISNWWEFYGKTFLYSITLLILPWLLTILINFLVVILIS